MFDHVTIRVADRDASERFYSAVLATLGHGPPRDAGGYVLWGGFGIAQADAEHPVTRGLHVGFAAPSHAAVDAFWRAGVDAGHADDGPPGPRPHYAPDYYGGFLRDGTPARDPVGDTAGPGGPLSGPDDNSVEAARHGNVRRGSIVDHLWVGVADLGAARAFYEAIAPHAGFRLVAEEEVLVRFATADGRGGSLTLVADGRPRTQHAHIAFPATEDATVDAFHAAAVAAGYVDNGAPGPRPEYHAGYYGAFVLDPDGNNAEVVHHTRR